MRAEGALVLFLALFVLRSISASSWKGTWTHRMRLDPNYDVYWSLDGQQPDHITFEVQVRALGYVVFGLSPTGLFQDADLVVGWIQNGRPRFQVK